MCLSHLNFLSYYFYFLSVTKFKKTSNLEKMSTERVRPTKIFLLCADPDICSDSVSRASYEIAVNIFKNQGNTVFTTDLVKDGWNEPVSTNDFTKVSDPIHVNLRLEQQYSPLIQKIQDEQSKLLQCELFLVFGPLSWFGLPSHFFAWWERVVTCGAMYSPGAIFDKGVLSKKNAMLFVSTTFPAEKFNKDTLHGFMEEIMYPITHGMFHMVGFKVHRTHCLYSATKEKLDEIRSKWPQHLRNICDRAVINFNKSTDYTNWKLNTTRPDWKNDFDVVVSDGIPLSLDYMEKA